MSPKKKSSAKGIITFHTPVHKDLFNSENYYYLDSQDNTASIRSPSQPSVKSIYYSTNQRTGSSEGHSASTRTSQTLSQDRHSTSPIRRLQAKMETEKQQTGETMQLLVNTENGFIKELENFLNHHNVTERRRRELLHKHWTEHVWLPLQKKLNMRVSSLSSVEIKRRQSLYTHFLQHCNSKGYVFLDTYNQKEYDPFFRHLKKPHYLKLAEMKARPKNAWINNSFETDSKSSSREEDKLPQQFQSSLVSSSPVVSQASSHQQTPSSFPASASTKTPTENNAERIKHSRSDNVLCRIDPKKARYHRSNRLFSA